MKYDLIFTRKKSASDVDCDQPAGQPQPRVQSPSYSQPCIFFKIYRLRKKLPNKAWLLMCRVAGILPTHLRVGDILAGFMRAAGGDAIYVVQIHLLNEPR